MSERCKVHNVSVFYTDSKEILEKTKYYTLSGLNSYLNIVESSDDYKSKKIDYKVNSYEI